MKPGILMVAYGSGNLRGTAALRAVQDAAETRFHLPVRWAFTSETIRLRLARSRTKSDSVLKALHRMRFERYTHVAVQSLHLIPGEEYEAVRNDCRAAVNEHFHVSLGLPLLSDPFCNDISIHAAAHALVSHISPLRTADEPIVCMAHGSRQECDILYHRWAQTVQQLDSKIYIACMVSPDTPFPNNTNASVHPDGLDQLIPVLKQLSSHRVWLLPLLSLAGRHTLEDMAGHSPHSWKSRLEAAGFFCQAELRSLADDPTFVQLWLDRLESAMHQLNILPSSKINTS